MPELPAAHWVPTVTIDGEEIGVTSLSAWIGVGDLAMTEVTAYASEGLMRRLVENASRCVVRLTDPVTERSLVFEGHVTEGD